MPKRGSAGAPSRQSRGARRLGGVQAVTSGPIARQREEQKNRALAATLPGFFVAVCVFHPEIIPADIMFDIAEAESKTPFPLMAEALIIHLIYEVVREAGLRMPVAIGHAVSIVGALVIGDTAVTAGLIGAPMLIVVALTAVCSSVGVRLHETVSLIRFALIPARSRFTAYRWSVFFANDF